MTESPTKSDHKNSSADVPVKFVKDDAIGGESSSSGGGAELDIREATGGDGPVSNGGTASNSSGYSTGLI